MYNFIEEKLDDGIQRECEYESFQILLTLNAWWKFIGIPSIAPVLMIMYDLLV